MTKYQIIRDNKIKLEFILEDNRNLEMIMRSQMCLFKGGKFIVLNTKTNENKLFEIINSKDEIKGYKDLITY